MRAQSSQLVMLNVKRWIKAGTYDSNNGIRNHIAYLQVPLAMLKAPLLTDVSDNAVHN